MRAATGKFFPWFDWNTVLFDQTITVVNTLGTITVAEGAKKFGGRDFTLTLDAAGSLGVTLGGITPDITGDLNTYYELEHGAAVTAETGAILDFDLAQTAAGADALVKDLSFALAQPFKYTLTVDGTQATGMYNLAGNATGFTKAITVKSTLGEGSEVHPKSWTQPVRCIFYAQHHYCPVKVLGYD